tara:strand:+ start:14 stop:241 length:228 start_codon:yes stop_codon:yes gene_type:complete
VTLKTESAVAIVFNKEGQCVEIMKTSAVVSDQKEAFVAYPSVLIAIVTTVMVGPAATAVQTMVEITITHKDIVKK